MQDMIIGSENITQKLGVSEATFIDLVHNHGLPAKKNSNQFSISVADLEKWERRSVLEPAPKPKKQKPKPAKGFKKKTKFKGGYSETK